MLPDRHALPASQRAAGYLPWVLPLYFRLRKAPSALLRGMRGSKTHQDPSTPVPPNFRGQGPGDEHPNCHTRGCMAFWACRGQRVRP